MPFVCATSGQFGFGRGVVQISSGLGLSSNNPGVNATQIYNAGNTSNAWYWIRTSGMAQSRRVWCNMADAGGGWMLVSYNGNKQNVSATAAAQWYPVGWSNGEGTLSGQFAANAMELWYNNSQAQCSSLMRIASVVANDTPTITNGYLGHRVDYTTSTNFLGLTIGSGLAGTGVLSASNTLMGATWTALKGYTLLSTHTTKADSDWMYNSGAGFYWNPILPINAPSRSGSGSDIGGYMRTSSKDSWGLSNVPVGTSSGGNVFIGSTLAVFVR
jgi:hypothetical protein